MIVADKGDLVHADGNDGARRRMADRDRARLRTHKNQFVDAMLEVGNGVLAISGTEHESISTRAAGELVVANTTIEHVVAEPTIQQIVPGPAKQLVRTVVAVDLVRERIARAILRNVGEAQHLNVGRKREAHRRHHGVVALISLLDHAFACLPDDIGVVAGATDQSIQTASAIEVVVAAKTGEDVRALIADDAVRFSVAGAIDVGRAHEAQVENDAEAGHEMAPEPTEQ